MWQQAQSYGGPVLTGPCLTMAATGLKPTHTSAVSEMTLTEMKQSRMREMTASPNLTTLPMEMLMKIFKYLSIPDIGNVLLVSRRLRTAGEGMVWREEAGRMPGVLAEVTMTVRTRERREINHFVDNGDMEVVCVEIFPRPFVRQ